MRMECWREIDKLVWVTGRESEIIILAVPHRRGMKTVGIPPDQAGRKNQKIRRINRHLIGISIRRSGFCRPLHCDVSKLSSNLENKIIMFDLPPLPVLYISSSDFILSCLSITLNLLSLLFLSHHALDDPPSSYRSQRQTTGPEEAKGPRSAHPHPLPTPLPLLTNDHS